MKITVCVPAYNESAIIVSTLKTIHAFCDQHKEHDWHVVVANNRSTDNTGELALGVTQTTVIEVLTPGKGAAVVETAKQDHGDIFCFIDADLSASPESLIELINTIEGGADVAIGSRLLNPSILSRSFFRTLSSQIFNILRKIILGINVADSQCGLKVMNQRGREVLTSCTETGWFFDMELLTKAERAGLTVREVAIPWQETIYPGRESKLNLVRDGIKGVLAMVRIRRSLSKNRELINFSTLTLLFIAAIFYSGFFLWHASAIKDTNLPKETFYYERGDSTGYVSMADSILKKDSSIIAHDESTRGLRTPGYPLFLASVFSFTREPFVIVILQILFALATIPFIYSIGKYLTNSAVSFLATLAYILYPTTAFLNTQILAETLFMFFTTLSLWLLLAAPPSWSPRYFAVGAAAGAAILIRPSFMYIVPLIIAYTVIRERKTWPKLIAGGTIAIAAFLIVSPWLNANQRDFGQASLSTAGNFNILYVYIPQFLAQKSDAKEGWLNLQQKFISETRAAGYQIGSHNASDYESSQIKAKLSGQWVSYGIFHIERSILTFVSSGLKMVNNEFTELGKPLFSATPWLVQHVYAHGISWELIKNNFLAFFDAALMATLAVLMPICIGMAAWKRNKIFWGLLLVFGMILISVLLAGPNGNARYRMPIQPYIFLLAFSSLYIIFSQIKYLRIPLLNQK